jgi:hypothetical protein
LEWRRIVSAFETFTVLFKRLGRGLALENLFEYAPAFTGKDSAIFGICSGAAVNGDLKHEADSIW